MMSMDTGEICKRSTVGLCLILVLITAPGLMILAHAQESVSKNSAPAQQHQQLLKTNPLNIKDSHWKVMKLVAEKIKNNPNHQVIYREVKGDRQILRSVVHFSLPDEYFTLSESLPPKKTAGGHLVTNITTLDDYVQRLAIQKAEAGVYVGVIGNSSRVVDVAQKIQKSIIHHHTSFKDSAPFVSGVFQVNPTKGELPHLSNIQKQKGLILYVRGLRYLDRSNNQSGKSNTDTRRKNTETTLATGIFTDENTMLRDMEKIWNLRLTYLNNAEYKAYIVGEIKKNADKGDKTAQFTIGKLYDVGEFFKEDKRQAYKWYLLAAKQGHIEALVQLGDLYTFGHGVKKDTKRAIQLYNQALNWYIQAKNRGLAEADHEIERINYFLKIAKTMEALDDYCNSGPDLCTGN